MRIEESNKLKSSAFSKLNQICKKKNCINLSTIKNPNLNPKNNEMLLNFSEKRNAKEKNMNYKDMKLTNRGLYPKSAKLKRIKVNIIDDNHIVKTSNIEDEENIDIKIFSQIEKINKIFEELSGNIKRIDLNINEFKSAFNTIIEEPKDNLNSISVHSINMEDPLDSFEENMEYGNIDELID